MGDQNSLSRALPCFGRHVKLLVPAAFAASTPVSRRVDVRQATVKNIKINAESLSQHDENML
jgi:hypothetical protein